MRERIIVSDEDGLRWLREGGAEERRAALEGAGALCVCGEWVFAASVRDSAIWRLDAQTLMPTAVYVGGPGMSAMKQSSDRERLFVLCADADSLLMLDARSGAPLAVNRVGVEPADLDLSPDGRVIAVAGGGSGKAVLLCSKSIDVMAMLDAPGIVKSAAFGKRALYLLSMRETLDTVCTTYISGGRKNMIVLEGSPGVVRMLAGRPVAATHGHAYMLSEDGARVVDHCDTPGRASRLVGVQERMILLDELSGKLYEKVKKGCWRMLASGVYDLAMRMGDDGRQT